MSWTDQGKQKYSLTWCGWICVSRQHGGWFTICSCCGAWKKYNTLVGGFLSKFLADLLVGVEALICTLVPRPAELNIVRAVHEHKNEPESGKEESKTSLDSMLFSPGPAELASIVELRVSPWCKTIASLAEFETVSGSAACWKVWDRPDTDHSTVWASVALHRTSTVPAASSLLLVTVLPRAGKMWSELILDSELGGMLTWYMEWTSLEQ